MTSPPRAIRSDLARQRLASIGAPAVVHYVALLLSFVALLIIGRDQWFFGDDWAVLVPRLDGDVLLPHVGHWNLIPAVVFPFLREWLGLSSYLPFLILALFAHLTVAHLVWRILNRVGVAAWIATLFSVFVMLLGGAAENLFWAFQFGFMGAIALGLALVLLLDRERVNVPAVIILSVLAPMFSGTAIPLLGAAAIVGWVRHGFIKTLVPFLPTAVIYAAWYLTFAVGRNEIPAGIDGLPGVQNALIYSAVMYVAGFGHAFPWIGLGVVAAGAAAIWFLVTIRRGLTSRATIAYALIIGSVAFVGLTAYSRMALGFSSAGAERYAYVIIVLLLPAIGILLTRVLAYGRVFRVVTVVVVAALIAFNVQLLITGADEQAARERISKERILEAFRILEEDPRGARDDLAPPDGEWSPDLTFFDVTELYERGELDYEDQ